MSPVVAYLASEECPVTSEIYSVGGGRVSRIFIAEGPGYFKKDLTLEDVRDNFEAIRSETDFVVPTSANGEIALIMPLLSGRRVAERASRAGVPECGGTAPRNAGSAGPHAPRPAAGGPSSGDLIRRRLPVAPVLERAEPHGDVDAEHRLVTAGVPRVDELDHRALVEQPQGHDRLQPPAEAALPVLRPDAGVLLPGGLVAGSSGSMGHKLHGIECHRNAPGQRFPRVPRPLTPFGVSDPLRR